MSNPGELSPIPGTVGERLRLARRRRFVGRAGEIELFRAMVEAPEPPCAVLFLHGPGGIGKTSLLSAFCEMSRDAGVMPAYLDARTVEPSPGGILAGLAEALGLPAGESPLDRLGVGGRWALLLDTYEAIAPLDDWLREHFLPRLPAGVPIVIASRRPPSPAWITDPGWHELLRVISLRNLSPEEARAYLRIAGLHHSLHDRVLELTHGHPLALSLFVDVMAQREGPAHPGPVLDLPSTPDLVRLLLERFIEGVPSARHRLALEVCAHSRFTTEDLVRHAVGENADELFTWLRTLSFVEEGSLGLFPHDLARDVLDADLRWRDPSGYAELHRRIRTEIVQRARSSEGVDQQRACTDMVFLHRTNPMVRPCLAWDSLGQGYADVLRPTDRQPILAMAERQEGSESAALAGYWMDRQPHAFVVFRRAGEGTDGFAALIALHHASPGDLAADPGAQALWDYALRYGPPAPGEEVVAHRFFMDADAYQGASPSFNHWAVRCIQHIISGDRLAWSFAVLADPDSLAGMFHDIDYHRAPEADFQVGGRPYGVFAHDFRRVSPEAWLNLISQREIGVTLHSPIFPARSPVLALSQPEFAAAVGQALRDLHRPDRLARNPLLSCRLARDRAGGDPPVRVLNRLLGQAVDVLRTDARDEKLYRAVAHTYLRSATTQERTAEMLGLPFSTYRRHLTRGVERVVSWLWDEELYGAGHTARRS